MTPLIAFYGDDFTGASAVMEVLAFAGVPTALFLAPPSAEDLARLPPLGAIGIAGVARSQSPEWMERHLPAVFDALAGFGAPIVHYKTCSTFDSAPHIGSIGRAIDIAAPRVGGAWHPLVVGAPAIRRYQAFGQLFAGTDEGVFRLDRHPVMARHPVTPMGEADVARHLSQQTARAIGLVDLAQIKAGAADAALETARAGGAEIVAIDVIDDETLAEAGRLTWNAGQGPVLAVGSQGVEYALVAHWRHVGVLPAHVEPPSLAPVAQIFCVSGSCSPINAAQIAEAEARGFAVLDLEAARAVDPADWARALTEVERLALGALGQGRDVLVATARGPDDPALARFEAAVAASGRPVGEVNDRIGAGLGALVRAVRLQTGLARVVIAGGDTSGHAMSALEARALSAVAPLAPGAPLCRISSAVAGLDGLEVALKGGQMGSRHFFSQAKTG